MTIVNIFPEVLERYLRIVVRRAFDRSFAIGPGGPYDLFEITGSLDAAAAGRLTAVEGATE
jgi:hypothetical protein